MGMGEGKPWGKLHRDLMLMTYTHNPLCLITQKGSKLWEYKFFTSEMRLFHQETFSIITHRDEACDIAHRFISASQDALYSRTEGQ